MASASSPTGSDDFVLLDDDRQTDLPLRQRLFPDQADEDTSDSLTIAGDDLEHISSPDSVRSLDTPSISPSETDNDMLISSLTLPATSSPFESNQSFQMPHQPEPDMSQTRTGPSSSTSAVSRTNQPASSLTSPRCHNHVTIDQQIMDLLIEHALTTRIEQEHGHGSASDKKLRQQMMTRFRSLPADHTLVQGSLSQVQGSKSLFPGQKRSMSEFRDIYHRVFTEIDRSALCFLTECHIRHFEVACQFSGAGVPTGRDRLYLAMHHPEAEKGKALALEVQTTVLGRLDAERAFRDPFDDLRRQTRAKIDPPRSGQLRRSSGPGPAPSVHSPAETDMYLDTTDMAKDRSSTISATRFRSITLRRILNTTLANLPNTRYSPNDPVNKGVALASKRDSPEDESDDTSAILSPPTKKPTLATRTSAPGVAQPCARQIGLVDREMSAGNEATTVEEYGYHNQASAALQQRTSPSASITSTADLPQNWRATTSNYDSTTMKALQDITLKIEYMNNQDKQARSESAWTLKDKKPFEYPFHAALVILEQQCKHRHAMARKEYDSQEPGNSSAPELPVRQETKPLPKPGPSLQPTGTIAINFTSLRCDNKEEPLTKYEEIWIHEYALRKALSCSSNEKSLLVKEIFDDVDTYRHVHENRLDPVDYYFRMDALMQVRSMQLLSRRNYFRWDNISSQSTRSDSQRAMGAKISQVSLASGERVPTLGAPLVPTQNSSTVNAAVGQHIEPPHRKRVLCVYDGTRRLLSAGDSDAMNLDPPQPPQLSQEPIIRNISMQYMLREQAKYARAICNKEQKERDAVQASNRELKAKYPAGEEVASATSNPHCTVQSSTTISEAEGPHREYRRDTLLAQSTNLPIPCAVTGSETPTLPTPSLSQIDNRTADHQTGLSTARSESEYCFAPALRAHESAKTLANTQEEMRQLQQQETKCKFEAMKQKSIQCCPGPQELANSKAIEAHLRQTDELPLRPRLPEVGISVVNPDGEGIVTRVDGPKIAQEVRADVEKGPARSRKDKGYDYSEEPSDSRQHYFESQTALLQEQNAKRLAQAAQREGEQHAHTSAGASQNGEGRRPPEVSRPSQRLPMLVFRNGIGWLAFEYKGMGVTMEYTIRTDIESLGIEPRSPDDRIAWALGELNPCLRRNDRGHLLQTAVKHYNDKRGEFDREQSSNRARPRAEARKEQPQPIVGSLPSPSKDPFILQSPDEIMADAELHEDEDDYSSSESEEDESDEEDRDGHDPPSFPKPFMDVHGTRYITFGHADPGQSKPTLYYSICANIESVLLSPARGQQPEDPCLCSVEWKQTRDDRLMHEDVCKIKMALTELNPILRGTENEALLCSAWHNYLTVRDMIGWHRAKSAKELASEGNESVINAIVEEADTHQGVVEFTYAEEDGNKWQGQCMFCSMIMKEPTLDVKVAHLRACRGYGRRNKDGPYTIKWGS